MYARVTKTQAKPGTYDQILEIVRNEIVPAAKQQPGFKYWIGFYDRTSGNAVTATVWETEADRTASGQDSDYYRAVMSKVSPMFAGPPVVEDYDEFDLLE